jgi:agarase
MRFFLVLIVIGLTIWPVIGQTSFGISGYYRAQQVAGRWQLIDPHGKPFLSKGIDGVRSHQDEIYGTSVCPYQDAIITKYGSIDGWKTAIAGNLFSWGFNTLGARSDDDISKIEVSGKHLAYTPVLDFGAGFVGSKLQTQSLPYAWMKGVFPDVFDPDFAKFAQTLAETKCAPLKDDPNLLGWFTDNEMRWGPDWRGKDELLVVFLNSPLHTPGRDAALALLRQRYPEIRPFNHVWGCSFTSWEEASQFGHFTTPAGADRRALTAQNGEVYRTAANEQARAFLADCDAFLDLLATRYFKITTQAIKAVDPNHLVIGCRFAYVPAPAVMLM